MLVVVDHVGYFFIDDDHWWSVFGRMAAPSFFFLVGYARTRAVPLQWIFLGVLLTLLDSSNNGWSWVAPNILLSFSLIRFARPHAQHLVQRYGMAAYAISAAVLVALLPIAAKVFDYGTEGWLWALLGMAQRMRADARSVDDSALPRTTTYKNILISILVCIVAADCARPAGTKGISVFQCPVQHVRYLPRHSVFRVLGVCPGCEPDTASQFCRRCFALHRPTHACDLCFRTRRL